MYFQLTPLGECFLYLFSMFFLFRCLNFYYLLIFCQKCIQKKENSSFATFPINNKTLFQWKLFLYWRVFRRIILIFFYSFLNNTMKNKLTSQSDVFETDLNVNRYKSKNKYYTVSDLRRKKLICRHRTDSYF